MQAQPLSRINLKLLQTFLLVAHHSSFRTAAEKAFRSPSAVSAQVRQLEAQLGVALFHRTTRNVRITREGEQMLECVQRALQEVESGLRKIQEAADMQHGRVVLSCSPTVAQTRLARVLAAFEQEYPSIEVNVHELTASAMFESVRQRQVDFGIGPEIDTHEFQFDPVMQDPLLALVPKHFITTAKLASPRTKTLSLEALADMPILMITRATTLRGMLDKAFYDRNLSIKMRYEFTQAQTLISMACAGIGVAILPHIALPPQVDASVRVLRISSPPLIRQISVITNRGQKLSPAALRMVQLLKQYMPDAQTARGRD